MPKHLSVLYRFIVLLVLLLPVFSATAAQAAPTVNKIGLFPEDCVSADELNAKLKRSERVLILDARSRISYEQGRIKGAVLVREKASDDVNAALKEKLNKYPKDIPIVTYCGDGCKTSAVMVMQIRRLGFANVKAMDDGFETWEHKGYPVERG